MTATNRDSQLAELIDRLTEAHQAGRSTDVDSLTKSHPELASELRELWAVAQFAHLAQQPKFDSRRTASFAPNGTQSGLPSPILAREFGHAYAPEAFTDLDNYAVAVKLLHAALTRDADRAALPIAF